MADAKISELTALSAGDLDIDNDVIAIVDSSVTQTKKITVADLVSDKADLSGATFTGPVQGDVDDTQASSSASLTLDLSGGQHFIITLTEAITTFSATNLTVGQSGLIVFVQNATGGYAVSTASPFKTPSGAGITIATTADAISVVPYIVKATGEVLLGTPQISFS